MDTSKQLSKLRQRLKYLKSKPTLHVTLLLAITIPLGLNLGQIRLVVQNYLHDDDYIQVGQIKQSAQSTPEHFTVVTVENPTTLFHQDGFAHGFGYVLLRQFVAQLPMQLDLRTVKDEATALKWVQLGKADMALSTAPTPLILASGLHAVATSCGAPKDIESFGLNPQLSMVFRSANNTVSRSAQDYVCHAQRSGATQHLAAFYAQNYLSPDDLNQVTEDLVAKLPSYKASFKQSANYHDLDWEFLVAIGYQESYLDPQSVSPTGVKGVMMLTQTTAKAMGVVDRNNPIQSIDGGAKYINQLLDVYQDISQPDRNWFALAAYNMGANHVNQIRNTLRRQGKNPDQWLNVYRYLQDQQHQQPRYKQTLQYVTRIRIYLEHIKKAQLENI